MFFVFLHTTFPVRSPSEDVLRWTCPSLFHIKIQKTISAKEGGTKQKRLVLLPAGNKVIVVKPTEVGRILPTFFDQWQLSISLETNKAIVFFRLGMHKFKSGDLNQMSFEFCNLLHTVKICDVNAKSSMIQKLPL